jgi:hypothetical protein
MNEELKKVEEIANEEQKKMEEVGGAKMAEREDTRIVDLTIRGLKVQIFDILEKQGVHQNEIRKLEQEKVKIYEEMNKWRGNNSG